MYRPDTSDKVQAIYDSKIRALTDEERFMRGLSLTHFCRDLCLSGIRQQSPNLGSGELRARFFETLYSGSFPQEEREKIAEFLRSRS